MYVLGDVSDPDSVDKFLKEAVDRFGTIDVVHNNAGVGLPDGPTMDYKIWCKEVDINLTGAFLVARGCAEIMKKAGHGGSIITTSSISGVVANAGVCYSATKAGVKHMSNALAMDYKNDNIRFNSVCYGYILSGLHEKFGMDDTTPFYESMKTATPIGRLGQLDDAVGVVLYLATDLSSFETGSTIIVDGGVCTNRRPE